MFLVPLVLAVVPAIAQGKSYFHGCGNQNLIEPREIVLTCADAKLRVEGLDWSSWKGNRAMARGYLVYPNCPPRVPLFRCQHYAHDPVRFKLFQPGYCPHFGVRYFAQGMVIDESAPTPATRNSPFRFDCPEKRSGGAYWTQCGDQHVRGAMWYDVKAHNVPCRQARGIAHAYVWKGDESPGGFSCESFRTGYETSRVACYRLRDDRSQKVRFSFGA
jgi:hypothetical protein